MLDALNNYELMVHEQQKKRTLRTPTGTAMGAPLDNIPAARFAKTMKILVNATGFLSFSGLRFRCALGRAGVTRNKREGDGATPAGRFPLRRLLYRPDRVGKLETDLPVTAITPDDGWCDDPADPRYNRPVRLPYPARCEEMWRDDNLYDLVVILGHNDHPVEPERGSAIFLHCARPDYRPTEGCVALAMEDLSRLVAEASRESLLIVAPGS